jgi:hypothetical protein
MLAASWGYEDEENCSAPVARPQRVVAVVTEHADGSWIAFSRGRLGEWPSREDAMRAVEAKVGVLAWRQSISGTWVGLEKDSQPLVTPVGERRVAFKTELDPYL